MNRTGKWSRLPQLGSIRLTGALPAANGRTSFVATADIGEAAAEALLGEAHGEIWTLTGPKAVGYRQVAATLSEVLGRDVQYKAIPSEAYAGILTQYGGVPADKASLLAEVFSVAVAQDEYAPVFDDLQRVLGRPAISFSEWANTNAGAFPA